MCLIICAINALIIISRLVIIIHFAHYRLDMANMNFIPISITLLLKWERKPCSTQMFLPPTQFDKQRLMQHLGQIQGLMGAAT